MCDSKDRTVPLGLECLLFKDEQNVPQFFFSTQTQTKDLPLKVRFWLLIIILCIFNSI